MAGNRVEYIIDLVVQNEKLANQMAKIDWEKIIGSKGKGISEAFTKGTKEAADQIQDTFHSINIDWKSILGEKDLIKLEKQLTKVISKKSGNIKSWLDLGDTKSVERAIDYVSDLGKQLGDLGVKFDSKGLARSMGAFMKAIAPLENEPQKIEAAFGNLFKNVSANTNGVVKSSEKITQVMAKIETSTKKTGGSQATLDKLVKKFEQLQNMKMPDFSKLSLDKLEEKMDSLDEKWDKLEERFRGKTNSNDYKLEKGKILKEMLAVNDEITKKGGLSFYDDTTIKDMKSDIQGVVKEFKTAIEELKKQVESKSFAEALSKQLGDIQIKLSLQDNAKEELKGKINGFIDEINRDGIKPIDVQIGYSFKDSGAKDGISKNIAKVDVDKLKEMVEAEINTIDDKITKLTKRRAEYQAAFNQNPNNKTAKHHYDKTQEQINEYIKQKSANEYLIANIHDEGVQKALTSTLNDFKAMKNVIGSQQSDILAKTIEWRQKMADAMNIGKGDVDFNFGIGKVDTAAESLLDELNAYFADNAIDITINKEKLKKDISEVLGNSGASLGGGTANINPKEFASAIMMGIKAAFTGDTSLFENKGSTQNTGGGQPSKKAIFLDPQDPYHTYMAKEFKELAKYAQGNGKPAESLRKFFNMKFPAMKGSDGKEIDYLQTIAESSDLKEAFDGLSLIIEKGGNSLDDQFKNLQTTFHSNKLVKSFGNDLSDLLYTLNIKQMTMSQDEISRQSIEVFKDFAPRQQLFAGLSKINKLKPEDLASLKSEDLEKWASIANTASQEAFENNKMALSEDYKKIANMFSALKTARERAGDLDDETKQQELLDTVNNFKTDIAKTYEELEAYVKSFDMHAIIKGRNPIRVKGGNSGRSTETVLRALKGDWSKLEDVTIQQMPNTAALGITNRREELRMMRGAGKNALIRKAPDGTDVLSQNAAIGEFTLKEGTSKKWQDPNTVEAQASAREESAKKLAAVAEKRAANLANIESNIATIEKEIANNEAKINKLTGDEGRKIAGAQTRIKNSEAKVQANSKALIQAQKALEQAKLEKEIAEDLYREVQQTPNSNYAKFDTSDSQIAKYKEWLRAPITNLKDIVGDVNAIKPGSDGIYRPDGNHVYYKELLNSSRDIVRAKEEMAPIESKLEYLRSQINKFANNPKGKASLDEQISKLEKDLAPYQDTINKNQAIIDDVFRKMTGKTKQDRSDFAADMKRKIGGYYDEYGDFHKGKLQNEQDYRSSLGADPREASKVKFEQANATLEAAEAELERAQSEYNKVLQAQKAMIGSDDYVKRASKITELTNKNEQLTQEITKLNQNKENNPDTQTQLNATKELESSIDSLINNKTKELEKVIIEDKAEIERLDQSVVKKMKQSAYKTPEYDIGLRKKESKIIDEYQGYGTRQSYLKPIIADLRKDGYIIPEDITSDMQQAIESLFGSKSTIKLFGENINEAMAKLGLDKFTSEKDVQQEVKARLDRNNTSKKKISPMVAEYYNKILNEGQESASQWLQTQLSASSQNIKTQESKLNSLFKSGTNINELEQNIQKMYQERINQWTKSIQDKISYLGTDNLSSEDTLVATKEVEELFKLTNKAINEYNRKYLSSWDTKIETQKKQLPGLQKELKTAIQKGDLIEQALIKEKIDNVNNIIKEYENRKKSLNLLTPEQTELMKDSSKYIYQNVLNKKLYSHQNELNNVFKTITSQISERSNVLTTRRAEILKSGASTEELKTELANINAELVRYQQYTQVFNLNTLFADDVKFADEYKNKLAEILGLEQQLDEARATGGPTSDLISELDTKKTEFDQSVYSKLQTKQQGLLSEISAFSKEGKNTYILEQSLSSINDELAKYELTNRRIKDSGIENELSLYGADEHVMRTYHRLMKETIRLEQELALAKAKSSDVKNDQDVIDAQKALSKHKNKAKKDLGKALEAQAEAEIESSARVQALAYLRDTEEHYQLGYKQRYALKNRIKRKEGQISDIAPDNNYRRSRLYLDYEDSLKQEKINEYIHSDQLKQDRMAGEAKVESEMKAYLEEQFGPEVAEQVLYQFKQSIIKGGEKVDPSKLIDGLRGLQTRDAGYKNFVNTAKAKETVEFDKLMVPYKETRDSIINLADQELNLIRNASEKDYVPLQQEMDRIKSRVDVASIEKELDRILKDASKKDKKEGLNKLKSKLMAVARKYGADTQEQDDLYNAITANVSNIRHGQTQDWMPKVLSGVFGMDDDRVRQTARDNLAAKAQSKIDKANDAYTKAEARVSKSLAAKTQAEINKYLDQSVSTAVKNLFSNIDGVKNAEEIANKFEELMNTYVNNLVSDFANGLHVGKNMPSSEEIRQGLENKLINELQILEEQSKPIEENIAHNEAKRKKAMELGGIARNEIADADIMRQQAKFTAMIESEKQKQKDINEEISRLEKEDGQIDKIAKLNKVLDASNEKIATWEMLIGSRDKLMDLQHQAKADEKSEKTLTPEQLKLWWTNQLEAAKLNLDSEDPTKKRIAEENVARYTDLLNQLEAKMATQESEEKGKGGIIGQLASLLKGAGGIALDASGLASQATLEQIAMAVERILVTLGGDVATSIVKDPEMEAKVARMRELEEKYGGKPGQKVVNKGNEKKSKKDAEELPKYIQNSRDFAKSIKNSADPINEVREAIKALGKETEGTEGYLEAQLNLQKAVNNFYNKNKTAELEGVEWSTYKSGKHKGEQYHKNDDMLAYLAKQKGITQEALALRVSEDKAKEIAQAGFGESQKQLENEKAKTAETAKQVENEQKETAEVKQKSQTTTDGKIKYNSDDYKEYNDLKKATKDYKGGQVVRNETEGLSTGLAKDETLQKILEAINNITKNGIPKGGKSTTSTKADSKPQKSEADLIKERALVNDEVVRKLSAGKAGLYDKYVKDVEDLNNAVKEANKADDKHKKRAINKVKTTADKVTALSRNIIRDTEEWEYKSAQGTVLKSFRTKKNIDQAYMENLAKQNAGVSKGQNQYKFLNFDGNVLTYQLTDIEGKVRQVTMEWNAFNKEIAITSDKSLSKLSGLAGQVDTLNNKFIEAQEIGYLHEEDKDLKAYYEQLKKIDELIKNGASFAEVDKARGKALNLGGKVSAKISKTKRLYNESEFGKVDNQRRKIIDTFGSQKAFDESELGILQQYKKTYSDLQEAYRKLHNEKKTLSAQEQEDLRQQTVGVESLGRKVIRQAKEIQDLNNKVENSGSYEDSRGNEIMLGGTRSSLSEAETDVNNLKNTMIDFAKNGLGHANIENIKFNKNTKTLTYNQRINKETVAEMEIQYKDATNSLYAYNKAEKESLTGWKGFIKDMKSKGRSIFSYLAYTTSIYRLISVVRQGITYIQEIDAAMTELRKVTDETEESYDRFIDTASQIAGKIGSTTKEIISSTADWARLGYSMKEATKLAESTAVLLNVSEFQSIDDATSALTSTMQAFGYAAEDSMHVVDVMNEIGNNYAVSSDGIATALQDSASSLMAANNSYQEAVALIAAANRVVILRHRL